MSKVTIEVAGSELDLAKGIGFGLNFAISDIKKIEAKNSNYSKTITLAGSKNNNKVLGGLFDVNADFTFFNPNIKTPARIIVDSSTVMDGFLQLKSIEKETDNMLDGNLITYKCVVSSKTVDFMTAIKDKKLNELDLTEFSHPYTYTSINTSWTNTYKDVFTYPMPYTNSNDIHTGDFKPAIFHKAYLLRIARDAGYKLSGSLMDDSTPEGDAYAHEVIPYQGVDPIVLEAADITQRSFDAVYSADIDTNTAATITNTANALAVPIETLIFDSEGLTQNTAALYNYTTGIHTVLKDGNYGFRQGLQFDFEFSTASVEAFQQVVDPFGNIVQNGDYSYDIVFSLYKNGNPTQYAATQSKLVPKATTGVSTFNAGNSYTVITTVAKTNVYPTVSLIAGDTIELRMELVDNNVNTLQYQTTAGAGTNVSVAFKAVGKQDTGFRNIVTTTAIGDVGELFLNDYVNKRAKQSDLVTDLVKRYNAYISVDPNDDRNIIIDTRDAYYAKGGTLDWTNKKDYSKKTTIKLLSELQNKEFEFTYTKDNDRLNNSYTSQTNGDVFGTKKIEFVNEFVKGTKKITTPFSPTPLVENSNHPFAIVSAISNTTSTVGDGGENLRVLYYGGLKDCLSSNPSYRFYHNGTHDLETTYPYAGHFDDPINPTLDINFGTLATPWGYTDAETNTNADLYNRFWKSHVEQINTGKLVTMYMNLNEVDISHIRHNLNSKIYIGDSYYYINKIVDYNPLIKGVTKVEFLKVNDGISFVAEVMKKSSNLPLSDMLTSLKGTDYTTASFSENTTIKGYKRTIGENSDSSVIYGDGNVIGSDSPNSVIYGNNNTVYGGLENVFIIGTNNRTVTESGTGWIGNIQYRNGAPVDNLPYYIYSALVTQTGTSVPTLIELQNTLGTVITTSYTLAGFYTLTSSVALTPNKSTAFHSLNDAGTNTMKTILSTSEDSVVIKTYNSANTRINGVMTDSFIEIRVYK